MTSKKIYAFVFILSILLIPNSAYSFKKNLNTAVLGRVAAFFGEGWRQISDGEKITDISVNLLDSSMKRHKGLVRWKGDLFLITGLKPGKYKLDGYKLEYSAPDYKYESIEYTMHVTLPDPIVFTIEEETLNVLVSHLFKVHLIETIKSGGRNKRGTFEQEMETIDEFSTLLDNFYEMRIAKRLNHLRIKRVDTSGY